MFKVIILFLLCVFSGSVYSQQVLCSVEFPEIEKTAIIKIDPETNPFSVPTSYETETFLVTGLYLTTNNILKTAIYGIINDRKVIMYSGEHTVTCGSNIAITHFGTVTVYSPSYYQQTKLTCWAVCGGAR